MAIIHFLQLDNGERQAFDFIMSLFDKADKEEINPIFPALIQKGLENLEAANEFPVAKYDSDDYLATLKLECSRDFEIELVLAKALLVKPIFEMRVDWGGKYFRAIYFPLTVKDENYYFFTRAFFKRKEPHPYDPTDMYRDKAKRYCDLVMLNPEKYIKRR